MNSKYRFIFISESSSKSRQFEIPKNLFPILGVFLFLIFGLFALFTYDYFNLVNELRTNKDLATSKRQLIEKGQLLEVKLKSLEQKMEEVEIFERKIRLLLGLPPMAQESDPKTSSFNEGDSFNLDLHTEFLQNRIFEKDVEIHRLFQDFVKYDSLSLDKKSFLSSTPSLLPARGSITSHFGPRVSPYARKLKMHEGLDVGAPIGTPIIAPADGVVAYSGVKTGFGNYVKIDHGYGIETAYAHASKLFVKKGEKVARGQRIANVGNTGWSTGPHLHYEVHVNGIAVDPYYYVLDHNYN